MKVSEVESGCDNSDVEDSEGLKIKAVPQR